MIALADIAAELTERHDSGGVFDPFGDRSGAQTMC